MYLRMYGIYHGIQMDVLVYKWPDDIGHLSRVSTPGNISMIFNVSHHFPTWQLLYSRLLDKVIFWVKAKRWIFIVPWSINVWQFQNMEPANFAVWCVCFFASGSFGERSNGTSRRNEGFNGKLSMSINAGFSSAMFADIGWHKFEPSPTWFGLTMLTLR